MSLSALGLGPTTGLQLSWLLRSTLGNPVALVPNKHGDLTSRRGCAPAVRLTCARETLSAVRRRADPWRPSTPPGRALALCLAAALSTVQLVAAAALAHAAVTRQFRAALSAVGHTA